MASSYPFRHHPCWTMIRDQLWERIHLPIAMKCNLNCIYCDTLTNSCHSNGPGSSRKIFSVEEAWQVLNHEVSKRDNLRIVGIAGPGEPLVNKETFEFLETLSQSGLDLQICLSTNGVKLGEKAKMLSQYSVRSVSVSFNAIEPATATLLYGGPSEKWGERIIGKQLKGIRLAREEDIPVKVNTILIPGMNDKEISEIARVVRDEDALLQNIVPLVPRGKLEKHRAPDSKELMTARNQAAEYIQQFTHCMQCRSDVVGIPGNDTILSLVRGRCF